jgi:hypothetical protein
MSEAQPQLALERIYTKIFLLKSLGRKFLPKNGNQS